MHADTLPITGPCPIDLDAIGFDRQSPVSHCTHCRKNVHILSNMTKDEARSFLRDNRGRKLCISYAKDERGRIRFRPEPEPEPAPALVPVARLRPRPSRTAGLAAALGVGMALAACTPHGEGEPEPSPVVEVQTVQTVTPPTTEPPKPEQTPPVVEVVPEPVPLAGAAVIPEDLVEGEIEIPDPDALVPDEPCDRSKGGEGSTVARTLQRL